MTGWQARQRAVARGLFAIDLRSLALFRVGLGLLVLIDLALRAPDLRVFYTEAGVLPRAERIAAFGRAWSLSVLDLAGPSEAAAGLLLALHALAGAALLVGFRTRLATLVCLLFVHGLRMRMPLVATGGDTLLQALLLWGAFLPLGARLSLDAARARGPARRGPAPRGGAVANVASFALLFQVASLFVFTGVAKLADPAWRSGDGVYFALTAEFYTTPLADWLLRFPGLVTLLDYAVLAFETGAPLLLLVPRRSGAIRIAFVCAAAAMSLSFWLFLRIGLFSWVTIVGLLPFLPASVRASVWERGPAQRPREAPQLDPSPLETALVALLCAWVFAVNLAAASPLGRILPSPVRDVAVALGIAQHGWPMFAPTARDHGWFVLPGRLADGGEVDLFRAGAPVDFARPRLLSDEFPSYRWRKYMMALKAERARSPRLRRLLAAFLCREWNGAHGRARRLESVELVYMREVTGACDRSRPGAATQSARRISLLAHPCE